MTARKLSEIAKTVRSKNAGVDKITFDVIFAERADYDLVRRSGVLSRAAVCRLFGIPESRITDYVEFDPALPIKFVPTGTIVDATSSTKNADKALRPAGLTRSLGRSRFVQLPDLGTGDLNSTTAERQSVEIGRQVFVPRVLEHASNLVREDAFHR
jgi:Domain of unknown function (DUF4387)